MRGNLLQAKTIITNDLLPEPSCYRQCFRTEDFRSTCTGTRAHKAGSLIPPQNSRQEALSRNQSTQRSADPNADDEYRLWGADGEYGQTYKLTMWPEQIGVPENGVQVVRVHGWTGGLTLGDKSGLWTFEHGLRCNLFDAPPTHN
ncbi:hypothetical protein BJ742DRAFT_780698 [Cladochytrium replicatum]|nr:hypothetical protein BJ742DRAFT_780698 [Cladochytrium replicatum]